MSTLPPNTMDNTLQVVIEHDRDGHFAYVPGLKGCHSQGDSLEEALKNILEATELYLETLTVLNGNAW